MKLAFLLLATLIAAGCTSKEVRPPLQPPSPPMPLPVCSHWNVGGTWAFSQSNGFFITFNIRQRGTLLDGTANNGSGPVPLAGVMEGNHFSVIVAWASGGAGLYTATMIRSGEFAEPFTQNISMPYSTATWTAKTQFNCL